MNPESFERQDREFMEKMKKLREQPLPEYLLKDFSDSVQNKIFERQKQKMIISILGVSFAVLAIAAAGLIFWYSHRIVPNVPEPELAAKETVITRESDVSEDLAVLEALGAWGEEDEVALGNALENALGELENSLNPGEVQSNAMQVSMK
ncbi:MAG: hypothetical protein HYZ84_06375 [Candidatus Omnitrophica bacterium]|nr:hypothetical protein [Candidatus Omnitrophota bacterium]